MVWIDCEVTVLVSFILGSVVVDDKGVSAVKAAEAILTERHALIRGCDSDGTCKVSALE